MSRTTESADAAQDVKTTFSIEKAVYFVVNGTTYLEIKSSSKVVLISPYCITTPKQNAELMLAQIMYVQYSYGLMTSDQHTAYARELVNLIDNLTEQEKFNAAQAAQKPAGKN